MSRFLASAVVFGIASFSGMSAFADDCPHLKAISGLTLQSNEDKTAMFAPVKIGGQPKVMLLDTGGVVTEIAPQIADDLALPRHHGSFVLNDTAGEYTDVYVTTSFELGGLTSSQVNLAVASSAADVYGNVPQMAGILGPDILRNYDLDVDFGTGKMNLMSQDHCDGKVIYWPADAVAVVPITVNVSGHIILTVQLDGQPVRAMLDTGTSHTALNEDVAEGSYRLKLGSADTPDSGALPERPGIHAYRHTFKTLALEGIAASNVSVEIIPNQTKAAKSGSDKTDLGAGIGQEARDGTSFSMLLGMDVLRHFHIYVAYKERKLYITPAGPTSVAAKASP